MRLAILLSCIVILSTVPLSANIVVTASPLAPTVTLGSATTVQIGISGLGLNAPPSLGAYDLNLAFDPAVLSFSGVTFGDPIQGDQLDLSGAGPIADFTTSAGLVEFFEISLDPAATLDAQQSDNFILGMVKFNAIGAGKSGLLLSVNSLADSAGASLSADLKSGSIDVAAVPEPSAFALLLLSAVALVVRRGNRLRI